MTDRTTHDPAFRRGVHVAVQAVVDNLAALVSRRKAAHSPELATQVIIGVARQIAAAPYPREDPGPAPEGPEERPSEPRPSLTMQFIVAALAAEESGLPVRILVTSDGVLVSCETTDYRAMHAVAWAEIAQATSPLLSHAVSRVIAQIRGTP